MKFIAGLLLTLSLQSFAAGNWDWYLTDTHISYPKKTVAAIESQAAGTSNLALWQLQTEYFRTHGFERSAPVVRLRYLNRSELGESVPEVVPVNDADLEKLAGFKRALREEIYFYQTFSKDLGHDAQGIDREEAKLIVLVTMEKAEGTAPVKYTIHEVRVESHQSRIQYEGNASSAGGSRR